MPPWWGRRSCCVSTPPRRPNARCRSATKAGPSAKPRVVQTYANCFVKRERPSRTLSADGPAPQPPASALRLRELPTDTSDEGEEC